MMRFKQSEVYEKVSDMLSGVFPCVGPKEESGPSRKKKKKIVNVWTVCRCKEVAVSGGTECNVTLQFRFY